MSNWGCPHEVDGKCLLIKGLPCNPGMKGCILSGRYLFSNPEKNRRRSAPKEPFVPFERVETVRQEIISLLEGETLSAREISGRVRISEKEVYEHLEHIQRGMRKNNHPLMMTPAECKKCGFIFRKRERLKRPGKCPVCHGESITEPLFSIR